MASSKPILVSYYLSSCAWRVRIALAYKGVEYEYKAVDLFSDKKEEKLKDLNPISQVPVFIGVEGKPIAQSMSILEYLEENYPEKPLLPKSSYERAKVREISELIISGIQPLQNLSVIEKLGDGMDKKEWCYYFNKKGLIALETTLKECSRKYCVGDQITFADCCLVPQVFAASVRFNVDLTEFPVVSRIYESLNALDAFHAAHPLQQPDAP